MLPRALLDTNVLLRLPQFIAMRLRDNQPITAFDAFTSGEFTPCICFQNLAEFWVVASRPVHSNGLGFSIEEVDVQVQLLRNTLETIPDNLDSVDIWVNLCKNYKIFGKKVHDARLAATALANGITTVVTLNPKDFRQFQEITVVEPKFDNS